MSAESVDRAAVRVEWHELLFAVRRSRRYHMRREQFFFRFHFFFCLLTAVSGSAAFATILADFAVGLWLTGFTAVVGAADLAGQPFSRALTHRKLTQRFTRLERAMRVPESEIDVGLLRKLEGRRLKIEVQEPPVLQVLNLICHNEEVLAGDYEHEYFHPLRWHQRLLAPLIDLRLSTFQQPSPGG